ncbi:hypothetical protein ACS0TY_023796 [Phlomoides rotata]
MYRNTKFNPYSILVVTITHNMTSVSNSPCLVIHRKLISRNLNLRPFSLSFPLPKSRLAPIKTGSSDGGQETTSYEEDLLRKPVKQNKRGEETWVDWEDQILEDTVPLVGFVRMILHSGKYESGDKLSPEHEKTILERLLPHHPECEKKIGCGVNYITVFTLQIGYHPNFDSSRCLFIVRNDGELVDFSYWKCIKGLIRKKYPLYADSFILRHFRRRRRSY